MKIVMINGQNHKGSTYNVGKLLIDRIMMNNKVTSDNETTYYNEITEFFLPRDLNYFCAGCYCCIEDETKCPYYLEKKVILDAVEEADLLIFTTPNYCMAPSAPMKSFIDLTFTYWMSHKPRKSMFHKKALVISTTAGMGAGRAVKPVKRTLFYWGVPKIYTYGVSVQASSWKEVSDKKKRDIGKHIDKLAYRLLKRKTVHVPLKTKMMFTMFSNMQKADFGSSITEKKYWEVQGWLGKERPWKK